MGWFQDFLNSPLGQRLEQHAGAEVAPALGVAQQQNPVLRALQGLLVGTTALPKAALDTVGLGLEGSANVAKGGVGASLLLADQLGAPLPGISPHDKALLDALTQVYSHPQNISQAYQGAINTVDQLRAHGDTGLAWGVGGASMALDPSNFLPMGKVEDVGKALLGPAKGAVLKAVKGEAPGVLAKVGEIAPETAAKIAQLPRQEIPSGPVLEQAVAKLTGAAGAAPEAAKPAVGPLKTIFGQDASVVHSGTYPGLPQSAPVPDVQQAVARLTGEAPASKQAAAALASDASINDKLNALEQNPNLPVQTGTPQSVLDFKAAFDSAYGNNAFARKNGLAKLQRELGVTFNGQTATFAKNGVDVTAPVLDFLNGRGAMGNDRKAIAAALDFTKGEVDNLAGGVTATPTPGAVAQLAPETAAKIAATPDLATAALPTQEMPAGKLGTLPANNYRQPLSNYTDRLYREVGIDEALSTIDPLTGDSSPRDIFFSNTPDLATGQGANRGIMLELDPAKITGQINTRKPAWQAAWDSGATEFIDPHGAPRQLLDAVRSVTIAPKIGGPPGLRKRFANVLRDLVTQGWQALPLPDGSTRYLPPGLGIAAGMNVPASVYLRGGGALAGGTLGALQSNNDPTAILTGALAGATGGAGLEHLATNQTLRDLALIGNEAGVKGMQDALQNGTFTLKGLAHDWSADKTKTVRGLALDTMTNYVRALVNKIPLADINASRADLIQQAKATGSTYNAGHPYTSMTADLFDKLGQDISQYDLHQAYGQGYLGSADSATKQLHPLASAAAGAGYSLASPITYLTSGLGAGVAAARGAARPYTNAAFNAINDLEHNAARDAGFRLAVQQQLSQVAPAFLEQIKAAGGDIKSLSADGAFSPKQAEAALPGAGQVWQDVLNQILGTPAQQAVKENAKKGIAAVAAAPQQDGLAAQFVKQAFGDYSTRSGFAKALGAVAPFSRYTLGQLPVLATLVAGHPGATLLVAKMLRDAGQRATQSGTPSYNANNLDVPNGTPLLGGLASIEAGGAPASGGINLLNSFSPVNVDIGSLGDITDPNKTPYEKAVALMGAVGLQPNPLIQTAAYALGGTDIAPGAQSRFSGLENILGGPQLPTVKAPLDALRKALGNNPSSYDPYQVAAAEIVLQQTGKPIRDPSNHALAVQTLDPNSPLMQQAKAQVDQGNAVKNLVSGLSPVSLTTTTDTKAQYRQAKANDPRYTKEQIAQAAQVSMSVAAQMQAVNAQIEQQNPALVTYSTPKLSSKDKEDPRLKAFDAKYGNLKDINPKLYAQLLAQYKQQVGIK